MPVDLQMIGTPKDSRVTVSYYKTVRESVTIEGQTMQIDKHYLLDDGIFNVPDDRYASPSASMYGFKLQARVTGGGTTKTYYISLSVNH